ncbi:MAG TPA: GNAT family N-acetyltransferase [Caulobacteraceae bacterium]
MTARYRIEPFAGHDRSDFHCGEPALDRYFRENLGQDLRRRAATAFVAVELESETVAGFYTLSAAGIDREALPAAAASKAPPYVRIPAILLGRLAIDQAHQGARLGRALLADALRRTIASGVGVHLMLVRPKSDRARSFYARFGFERLEPPSELMFLPISTALKVLA